MKGKRRSRHASRGSGTISVSIIVLVFLTVMAVQIYQMKQKDEAYAAQEDLLQEQYEEETQRAEELVELEAYMQSDEYIEDTAKNRLGLVYDNEIIFKDTQE